MCQGETDDTLIGGFNREAVLTSDTARLTAFSRAVFGATVNGAVQEGGGDLGGC